MALIREPGGQRHLREGQFGAGQEVGGEADSEAEKGLPHAAPGPAPELACEGDPMDADLGRDPAQAQRPPIAVTDHLDGAPHPVRAAVVTERAGRSW